MWFWRRFFSLFWPSHLDLDLDLDSNLFGLGLDSDSNLFGLGLDSDSNLFGLGLVLDSTKVDLTTALPKSSLLQVYLIIIILNYILKISVLNSITKPKLKPGLVTSTWLNLINSKIFSILHHQYCCYRIYIYIHIPCTTCLHIPLAHTCLYYYLLSPQYTILHILFYCTLFFIFSYYFNCLPIFMYILLCCVTIFCTVHWADLTWLTFHYWLCDE